MKPDGSSRDSTLRDARKHGWYPSVTEILNIVSKPMLTKYFIKQHLEAAWDWGVNHPEAAPTYDDWCREVKTRASQHANEARDKGSAIHNSLERWYEGKHVVDHMNYVEAVDKVLFSEYGISPDNMDSERTFAYGGYGGAVDLSSPDFIVDYKFKSGGWTDPKKLAYDNHIGQLAAYRNGLGYENAKLLNVFISPDHDVYVKEWSDDEVDFGTRYFNACLVLWQTIRRYAPCENETES